MVGCWRGCRGGGCQGSGSGGWRDAPGMCREGEKKEPGASPGDSKGQKSVRATVAPGRARLCSGVPALLPCSQRVTGCNAEPRVGKHRNWQRVGGFSGRRQEGSGPGWRAPSTAALLALGRFWAEAERVRCWGKGRILSPAPYLPQPPRPTAPSGALLGPDKGDRGHWEALCHPASPKMT